MAHGCTGQVLDQGRFDVSAEVGLDLNTVAPRAPGAATRYWPTPPRTYCAITAQSAHIDGDGGGAASKRVFSKTPGSSRPATTRLGLDDRPAQRRVLMVLVQVPPSGRFLKVLGFYGERLDWPWPITRRPSSLRARCWPRTRSNASQSRQNLRGRGCCSSTWCVKPQRLTLEEDEARLQDRGVSPLTLV